MFIINQKQRLDIILLNLQKNNSLTLQEILDLTGSSRDTARRDIIKLVNNNMAVRNYGGLSLPNSYNKLSVFLDRMDEEKTEKQKIAESASKLVQSGDFLYLDVSTTVSFLPQYLKQIKSLFTITNSIDIADKLLKQTACKVRLLGGNLDREKRCVTGTKALSDLTDYHFNKAFLSAVGITQQGIFYAYDEDIEFKKQIRKRTDQLILLLDHKKINATHNFHVFNLKDIDVLITTASLPKKLEESLNINHVKIIKAKGYK
ncbi:DeoR/GlpR family DNA-binding transcription regulator [Lactobacillus rizhaonensis]|uniref:DeoR/GlpR family DNA-binding transcription regulator n=1 Tax=Lactobacillus rizhaonensis TaxID=3082863 RepID=UPI0030C67A3D